jgi:hypothetical protein
MTQKWNLQDIRPVKPKKRPSYERPLDLNRREQRSSLDQNEELNESTSESILSDVNSVPIIDGNKSSRKKYLILSSVVAVLIIFVLSLSAILSKTTLTVYPENRQPVVNAEFTAYPERRDSALTYEVITIDETKEKQVAATGEEYVDTRFEAPGGIIFRIQEPVVVPGALKDASGTMVPGTIRAEVLADKSGQEYNLPSNTKFSVPGFKESNLTELYNSIYATNKEEISGGYKGQKFLINDAELSTARQELQLALRASLLERIKNEKPAGFTSFDTSVAIVYTALPTISYGENLVTIREQAVLQLPLFKEAEFASFIAKETVSTYGKEPVRIVDTSTLEFSYKDIATNSSNIANLTSLNFKLTGKPLIVSEFNADQLRKDLAGKSKTSISTVLTAHPGIKSAKVESKPFWRTAFPENPEEIVIEEVIDDKN